MSRKTTTLIIIGIIVLVAFFVAAAVGIGILVASEGIASDGKVALIRIEGVITSGRGTSSFFEEGAAGAESIVCLLEKFRKDSSANSLVLRINSPGGSAAGSQEVYQEIQRIRRDGKTVTVSMGDVAASGGYYIACAANRIYADPATLTGSIGVIMETADIHELLDRFGIDMAAIKSGKHKDMGSFARPMTPEEKTILQNMINDVFDQFVTDVSTGRKLPKPYVLELADGRVYTGRQAVKLKLVDKTGSLEDALKAAALDAGIKGEFSVIEYEKAPSLFDIMFGTTDAKLPAWGGHRSPLGELAERILRIDQRLELRR